MNQRNLLCDSSCAPTVGRTVAFSLPGQVEASVFSTLASVGAAVSIVDLLNADDDGAQRAITFEWCFQIQWHAQF